MSAFILKDDHPLSPASARWEWLQGSLPAMCSVALTVQYQGLRWKIIRICLPPIPCVSKPVDPGLLPTPYNWVCVASHEQAVLSNSDCVFCPVTCSVLQQILRVALELPTKTTPPAQAQSPVRVSSTSPTKPKPWHFVQQFRKCCGPAGTTSGPL